MEAWLFDFFDLLPGGVVFIAAVFFIGFFEALVGIGLIMPRLGIHLWQTGLLKKRRNLLRLAEVFFHEHGGKSVFLGRFLGPIRGLIPFVAGASRMRPRTFFAYAIISGLLWGISYPGVGYLGGTSWQRAETLAGRLGLLIVLICMVTCVIVWLRQRFLPGSTLRKAAGKSKPKP
ncbi:MAG: VTT domain-containing protein [Desulfuromonadales bacterium]